MRFLEDRACSCPDFKIEIVELLVCLTWDLAVLAELTSIKSGRLLIITINHG